MMKINLSSIAFRILGFGWLDMTNGGSLQMNYVNLGDPWWEMNINIFSI